MRMRQSCISALLIFACVTTPEVLPQEAKASAEGTSAMPEFFGQNGPAPDWAVWRAFYQVLDRSFARSPEFVARDLSSRLRITQDSARLLLELGRQYLSQGDLERMGSQNELAPGGSRPKVVVSGTLPTPTRRRAATPEELNAIGRRVSADRLTKPVTSEGGMVRLFENEEALLRLNEVMSQSLESHLQQVIALIGVDGHERLTRWIDSEVKDQVRWVTHGARISTSTGTSIGPRE